MTTIENRSKLTVCSTAFAVALWGMSPVMSAELRLEPTKDGKIRFMEVSPQQDHSLDILELADKSAVDTEWAHFRGAIDTEWA